MLPGGRRGESGANAMAPSASRRTIERFYGAFQHLDWSTMQQCYAADARFEDEAFSLEGREQIGAMWRMLCEATMAKGRAQWKLSFSDVDDASANWVAQYLFSATGRLVTNRIAARFEFDEQGLITHHRDRFDFWAWSRQALGLPGWLLGWSPWLRAKVRARAAAQLRRFVAAKAKGR